MRRRTLGPAWGCTPSGPTELNPAHPLAPYLSAFYAPGLGRDLAFPDNPPFGSLTSGIGSSPSAFGQSLKVTGGSGGTATPLVPERCKTQAGTIVVFAQTPVQITGSGSNNSAFFQMLPSAQNAPRVGIYFNGSNMYFQNGYGGGYGEYNMGIDNSKLLSGSQIAISYAGGGSALAYQNGVQISQYTVESGALGWTAGDIMKIGGGVAVDVYYQYIMWFNRVLTAQEMQSVYFAPASLLRYRRVAGRGLIQAAPRRRYLVSLVS